MQSGPWDLRVRLRDTFHVLGQVIEMGFPGAQAGKVKDGMDVQTTLESSSNGGCRTEESLPSPQTRTVYPPQP